MDWDFFFRQLEAGVNVGEICFYFADDPDETERYLGYMPTQDRPYWIGACDIQDGCNFSDASALVNASVFDGKSLKDRWDNVVLCSIEACSPEWWMESFYHI